MKKFANKKNVGILLIVCFSLLSLCLIASFSVIRDKHAAFADNENTENTPTVKVEHITSGKECVQITFRTEQQQVFWPSTLDQNNLSRCFSIICENLDTHKDVLKKINDLPVTFVFDGWSFVSANTVTSKNINSGFDLINNTYAHRNGTDSSTPLINLTKVNIKELKFPHGGSVNVKLNGENAISDFPTCEYLEIEWAAFKSSNCITNMPKLSKIYIYNHTEGYSSQQINNAIKGVQPHCECEVRLDFPNKLYYYVPTAYDNNGTIKGYQWSDNSQNVEKTPREVKYSLGKDPNTQKNTLNITIVGNKNSNDFGYATLKGAFDMLKNNYAGKSWFWDDFATCENISLRIEVYGGYQSDCISQNNINSAINPLKKYMPAVADKQFNLTKIELICANACQVYFRGPACIHDCPYLTNILVERANFPNPDNKLAPSISNCRELSFIKIENRSERYDNTKFNSWVQGVKDNCKVFVKCWFKDGHYKFTVNNANDNSGVWTKDK